MPTVTSPGVLGLEADRPARVVVLRALQLGDLLCAVPAFRALRTALPGARIALVGLPWAADFVSRFHAYLDEFIEFPGYPGLPERAVDVRGIPPFLQAIQRRGFDLAVQMQGDGTITNGLVSLFGARLTAGFSLPGGAQHAGAHLAVYPAWLPEPRRHLYLVEWLTGIAGPDDLEFPIRPDEEDEWGRLWAAEGLRARGYACLHAGARDPNRRWPVERFVEVASDLVGRGLRVVLTGDGPDECARAQQIASACTSPVTDLSGRISLGALAAVVRDARVLVCNDTGVSHLAAALRTPSVIVFRTTDPDRWAPLDRRLHRVVRDGAGAVRGVLAEAGHLMAREGARAA
jgi:ADP-heptose:LPS heptosyltransferase